MNNPFYYTPTPYLCEKVEEMVRDITRREEWRDEVEKGKMFGAMLARDEKGETVLLKAYSG